jgi:hypothetical protein
VVARTKPVLRHQSWIPAVGASGLLLSGTLAVLSLLPSNNRPGWLNFASAGSEPLWVPLGFGAFALLGVYLVTSYFLERHELSEQGLTSRTALGRRKLRQWSDLQAVQYCPYPRAWFRIQASSGLIIRISFGLRELPALAGILLERAPTASMNATTRDVLRAVALGHPPPLTLK